VNDQGTIAIHRQVQNCLEMRSGYFINFANAFIAYFISYLKNGRKAHKNCLALTKALKKNVMNGVHRSQSKNDY
jgi:hypothetical protein